MRNLRILILEDDQERMAAFRNRFAEMRDSGKASIVLDHVEHVADLIPLLQNNEYDLIFLDHDLGGEQYVDEEHEDCGMRAAEFLAQNPDVRNKHGAILVHSLNNVAAPKMARLLKCHRTPGVWIHDEWNRYIRIN